MNKQETNWERNERKRETTKEKNHSGMVTTPYELKLRFAIQIDTKAETTWVETLYYHDKIIAI